MYGMTTMIPSMNSPVDGFGFLLVFALLEKLCWVVVVLWDFEKVINLFCKEFKHRTHLFRTVNEGVDNR